MIIADTSVWISFLKKDDDDLQLLLKSYLKKNRVYAISAVFGELLQGVKNKKERQLVEFFWEYLPKIDETGMFLKAGVISNENKLYAKGIGFTDCYILAAALDNQCELWTLDKKLGQAANELTTKSY